MYIHEESHAHKNDIPQSLLHKNQPMETLIIVVGLYFILVMALTIRWMRKGFALLDDFED